MNADILGRLARGERLLCDGAMGTMLFRHGVRAEECPERLNFEDPKTVENIARAYLDAGADIILTNTFGGSALKLSLFGLEKKCEEINETAVRLARRAIGHNAILAASVGPSGGLLEPYGDIDPSQMYDSFHRQIKALLEAGVDMIAVETMTDISEARLAIKAIRDLNQSIPLGATMTFENTPKGFHTIMGVSIKQAAEDLVKAGADMVGSNCGNGIQNMIAVASEYKKHTKRPLIIQPNAGLPVMHDGHMVYPETPEFMAAEMVKLLEIGVAVIGGCCGTTPDHIRAFRRIIDEFK